MPVEVRQAMMSTHVVPLSPQNHLLARLAPMHREIQRALTRRRVRGGLPCRPDAASGMASGRQTKDPTVNIHLGLTPVISLLAGILILIMPKLLNYIIAFYLIAIGLIGILGLHQLHIG